MISCLPYITENSLSGDRGKCEKAKALTGPFKTSQCKPNTSALDG